MRALQPLERFEWGIRDEMTKEDAMEVSNFPMRGGCRSGSVRYALLGPLAGVSGGACPAKVSSLRLLSFDMGGFKNRNEE